ncbi:hypothetical protein HSR121_0863 [Halapricum desulfuricans]|uniref:Uncharacterized protein n=1 Tax=Halapricum desulfuricans TaxID=2841257 RepID=A0A897N1M6_9EURY|nr:hypothetical protein HSR121_0863 [Halapricum desulfuricans]
MHSCHCSGWNDTDRFPCGATRASAANAALGARRRTRPQSRAAQSDGVSDLRSCVPTGEFVGGH